MVFYVVFRKVYLFPTTELHIRTIHHRLSSDTSSLNADELRVVGLTSAVSVGITDLDLVLVR